MNKKQKIALIIGGIVLAIVLITTQKYQYGGGAIYRAGYSKKLANQYSYNTAIIRGVVVVALTFSAYIALKSKG
ncbi:MAG: hypothetical protein ACE5GU_13625 [Candidatus Scalinduaceae bacterium]